MHGTLHDTQQPLTQPAADRSLTTAQRDDLAPAIQLGVEGFAASLRPCHTLKLADEIAASDRSPHRHRAATAAREFRAAVHELAECLERTEVDQHSLASHRGVRWTLQRASEDQVLKLVTLVGETGGADRQWVREARRAVHTGRGEAIHGELAHLVADQQRTSPDVLIQYATAAAEALPEGEQPNFFQKAWKWCNDTLAALRALFVDEVAPIVVASSGWEPEAKSAAPEIIESTSESAPHVRPEVARKAIPERMKDQSAADLEIQKKFAALVAQELEEIGESRIHDALEHETREEQEIERRQLVLSELAELLVERYRELFDTPEAEAFLAHYRSPTVVSPDLQLPSAEPLEIARDAREKKPFSGAA